MFLLKKSYLYAFISTGDLHSKQALRPKAAQDLDFYQFKLQLAAHKCRMLFRSIYVTH